MQEKVVVFGGSGFLGSHIADQLSDRGYKVVIFANLNSEYLRTDQEMVVGDITDQELIREIIKGSSYVYHLAAIADIKEAEEDPILTVKVNVLSTIYILDACREHDVKRFIYGSTIYVYSQHGSFYRSSKQSSELFIENYQKIYGVNYTVLRYGSLYGPRANHFNFINNIINQAITEKVIRRKGDGNELRDYIHVVDAAEASVNILDESFINSNVMITGHSSLRVKDLLNMVKEIFNNEIEVIYEDEVMEGHYEITPYSFKPQVAKKYLLNHYHDLGQGILEMIYRNHEDLIKKGRAKS
ncbi:MAG: NAD(P)-dependent oxidoreductase [Haliscomenobacter sp.]|nr:NAD(P)-dependent oxidoreductase [Haliscomenobacter sp.]